MVLDMNSPWFDMEAFRQCSLEQGTPLFLCQKGIVEPANPEYAVKAQVGFTRRSVQGHIERKQSRIPTDAGWVTTEKIFAYILAIEGFTNKDVLPNSRLLVGSIYYQMELVDEIYSRGVVLQYKYSLVKTDGN